MRDDPYVTAVLALCLLCLALLVLARVPAGAVCCIGTGRRRAECLRRSGGARGPVAVQRW